MTLEKSNEEGGAKIGNRAGIARVLGNKLMQGATGQPARRQIVIDVGDSQRDRGDFAFRQGAPFDLSKISSQGLNPLW